MTIILGDSLVKYLKGLELSDKNNKVVTKHFSGATTNDTKLYVAVTTDEVYDAYVDINYDLEINCNIYNMLIAKAKY